MIRCRVSYTREINDQLAAGELNRSLYPEHVMLDHYPRKNDEFELNDDTTLYVQRSSTRIREQVDVLVKGSVTMFLGPDPIPPGDLWP